MNSLDNYVQPTEPSSVSNCVRLSGLGTVNNACSFVLVFRPEYSDPLGKSVLFGSEMWWLYRNATTVGARGGVHGGSYVEPFLGISGILNYQINILIGSYKWEEKADGVILVPGRFTLWLNGARAGMGSLDTVGGGGAWPTYIDGAVTRNRDYGFYPGSVPHNYHWLATQSSDGARTIVDTNYYSFAGMFREFAWWNGVTLTDADATVMLAAHAQGGINTLAQAILARNPSYYDRFQQPRPPRRPVGMVPA